MSQQKPRPERTTGAAWLRGGQTISHNVQMIWEVTKNILIATACWAVFCVYTINKHATDDEQLYGGLAILAKIFAYLGAPLPQNISVRQPDQTEISVSVTDYESLPYVASVLDHYGELIGWGTVLFVIGAAAITAIVTVIFIRQGQRKLEDREMRGQTITSVSSLRRQIQTYNVDVIRGMNRRTIAQLTGVQPPDKARPSHSGFKAALMDAIYQVKRITQSVLALPSVQSRLSLRPAKVQVLPPTSTALVPYKNPLLKNKAALAARYYRVIDMPYWVTNGLARSDVSVIEAATDLVRTSGKFEFYPRYDAYIHHKVIGIELPIHSLFQHSLVVGSPGSGKSQAIHSLIESIIRRKECAIIYDPELEYIRAHYKPGRDVILNPFDARSLSWSPFNDLSDYSSWEMAAADLFPLPKDSKDPYWTLASRQVYCNAGYKLTVLKREHLGEKPTIEELIWLMIGDFETLHYFLLNTPAEKTLGEREGLRSDSLRSVIINGITRMMHLLNGDETFSLKDWINSPQTHGLLFLSRPQHLEASLNPLLAHWSSIAITTLFSRTPEQAKKITHLILDEFHSLGKLDILADAPARLRKYGGSMIMGMQQVSQLEEIYGSDKAQTIIGQLATKLILRCQDPKTARFMAEQIGQREVSRTQENTSYGAHMLRDGVSLNTKEQTEFVYMPEEIMNFPMFHGVLRVSNVRDGSPFPIAPVKFRYTDRYTSTEGFEPRTGPDPIDAFMKKDRFESRLFSILKTLKSKGQGSDNREMASTASEDAAAGQGHSVKPSAQAAEASDRDAENPEKLAGVSEGLLNPEASDAVRIAPDLDIKTKDSPLDADGAPVPESERVSRTLKDEQERLQRSAPDDFIDVGSI
ncbi:MAG: hypothetical protein B7Z26_00195 [Asticcacaulis sp. 32-58-5]|nr:MAG: hypothetical protein B7Z26_00195 [Asticcacaulis sp. 32-58-5]